MIRVLLFLLAVLVAVLGYVLERPWLYAAAAVPLAGGLALLARGMWSSYNTSSRRRSRSRSTAESDTRNSADSRTSTGPRDESLEEFGIVDVRPQEEEATPADSDGAPDTEDGSPSTMPPAEETAPPPSPDAEPASSAAEEEAPARETSAPAASSNPPSETEPAASSSPAAEDAPPPDKTATTAGDAVLTPYVEALRAALDAHTVCFLAQTDVALDYDIRAIASESDAVRHSGTFETKNALLTPQMMDEPITIRPLGSPDVVSAYLGYYRDAPAVDHVALAPVPVSDAPEVYFLLADTLGDTDLDTATAGAILQHFAETLAVVLNRRRADATTRTASNHTPSSDNEPADPGAPEATDDPSDEDDPRPRTDIIAEEMAATDADEAPLSLLLVHLNRAEAIARKGDNAVEDAEMLFAQRLDAFGASSRVIRFGELTYGIFYRGDADAVEPFATELQDTMRGETGVLEGGVSIGVAVRSDRHTPQSLREDATKALSESYKTGACTIVE